MSENCRKDAEDNTVFDKTEFADRRAKSIDRNSTPESDKLNLLRTANSISAGGGKHGVDHDDYSSGSDATAVKPLGPRTIEGYEAKWAAGHSKVGGRHVAADGLVARSGRRRILPNEPDVAWLEDAWLEDAAEKLGKIAKETLHGRNATVFEGRVLDPLMGRRKRSVEELAAQFGVTSAKIHKITEKAKERVAAAVIRYKQGKSLAPEEPACPTCGRWYSRGWEPCRRGYGFLAAYSPFTHPECCPPSFRKAPRAQSIRQHPLAYHTWWVGFR